MKNFAVWMESDPGAGAEEPGFYKNVNMEVGSYQDCGSNYITVYGSIADALCSEQVTALWEWYRIDQTSDFREIPTDKVISDLVSDLVDSLQNKSNWEDFPDTTSFNWVKS